jgi:hypothetical protein
VAVTREERGLALPLALLTLVVIGAVVAGGFAAALLEQRTGRNTLYLVQAAAAAEAGAAGSVGEWRSRGLEALLPGEIAVLPQVQLSGGATYQATVHRLNAELFELRVAGTLHDADGGLLASRELSLLLRQADSAAVSPVTPLANRAWSWPAH